MENNDYPVLCGSTFFSLLVDYLKPAHSVRDRYAGRSSITNPDMLAGLLQIIDSGFVKPADKAKDSFKTLTANYKSGLKDERTFLHEEQLKKFDINVGDNYYQYLKKMSLYLDYIIPKDANNEYEIAQIKLKPLVISLIKLIEDDRSIEPNREFYILPNGDRLKKSDFHILFEGAENICLPAFLLGLWHYIIYRTTNIGKHKPLKKRDCSNGLQTVWPEDKMQRLRDISLSIPQREIHVPNQSIQNVNDAQSDEAILNLMRGTPDLETKIYYADGIIEEVLPQLRKFFKDALNETKLLEVFKNSGTENDYTNALGKFIELFSVEFYDSGMAIVTQLSGDSIHERLHIFGDYLREKYNSIRMSPFSAFDGNSINEIDFTNEKAEMLLMIKAITGDDYKL